MPPSPLVEGLHPGEYIVSEGLGHISRDQAIITGGVDLVPGTVLGEVLLGTETTAAGTNTGNGTMGTVTLGAAATVGAYTLKFTKAAAGAGDFEVIDPAAELIGVGTAGVAFNAGGLAFTLAVGGTNFVVGDSFTLTVAPGSGKYKQLNPAAADGTQIAAAILFGNAYASQGDQAATITSRSAEVGAAQLVWPAGITGPQQAAATAQLAAKFIILR